MRNKKIIKTVVFALVAIMILAFNVSCKQEQPPQNNYVETITYSAPKTVDIAGYNTYYFDGVGGNDQNSGKSQLAPKKSLSEMAKIASMTSPDYPVRILLKRGSEFSGKLTLTGYTASAEKPLIISDYGNAENMPKLVGLNNDTDTSYSVIRLTESNTRISNLEITDPYAYQGINVYAVRVGKMENIVIEGCYVHDVNFFWDEQVHDPDNPPTTLDELDEICPEFNKLGSYGRYYYRTNGGIIFQNDTKASVGASWYENVYAINNVVERVARTGIYMSTKWSNAPGVGYGYNKFVEENDKYNDAEKGIGYFMHKNVNFCGNKLNVIGGDGIVIAGIDSFLEGNVCYRANYLGRAGRPTAQGQPKPYFNAAIWCYNSNNLYFQNNEAAYTFLRNGAGDGEGFDIDNACKNIYFQYNYAHHNEGGGLLVCNTTASLLRYDKDGNCISPNGMAESLLGAWGNNYCRNNVFAYNGKASDSSRSAFVTIARQTDNFYCYNNTVILGVNSKQNIINQEESPACIHTYANNIFYSENEVDGAYSIFSGKTTFDNNLYYNVGTPYIDKREADKVLETTQITDVNPQISSINEFDGFDKAFKFKANNQEVYNLGKILDSSLKYDLNGKLTVGVKYLGAFAGV